MKRKTTLTLFFLWLTFFAKANDSLSLFKEFLQVCNAYKQMPLTLHIEYKNSSNIYVSKQDSAAAKAEYYINGEGAYIRFGTLEQLVSDSIILVVMTDIKQMVVSVNNTLPSEQLAMMGSIIADTSIIKMSKQYLVNKTTTGKESSVIQVTNRTALPGSQIPSETIELTFNMVTKEPETVVTTKRRLIPISIKDKYPDNKFDKVKLITVKDLGDFYVKEDVTIYSYKSIGHTTFSLPVKLTDRVIQNGENNYVPVKNYADYTLINN